MLSIVVALVQLFLILRLSLLMKGCCSLVISCLFHCYLIVCYYVKACKGCKYSESDFHTTHEIYFLTLRQKLEKIIRRTKFYCQVRNQGYKCHYGRKLSSLDFYSNILNFGRKGKTKSDSVYVFCHAVNKNEKEFKR